MAVQISINTNAAEGILRNTEGYIQEITDLMAKLDTEVNKLLSDADWKGDAADKFFAVYNDVRPTFTQKVPEDLTVLKDNINTNLRNLVEADAAGTR